MGDQISMEFSRMDDLAGALAASTSAISGVLTRLEQQAAGLQGQWTGAASAAYQKAHAEWSVSFAEMNRVLSEVHNASVSINERHRAGEQEVSNLWG